MKKFVKSILISFSVIIVALFFFLLNASASVLNTLMPMDTAAPSCESVFGDATSPEYPAYWIQMVLDVMKYAAIIALLGLSIADFVKAIVSDDKDALKKAGTTSIKRFIYCVIIFFLPIIVNFLMNLFGFYSDCDFR